MHPMIERLALATLRRIAPRASDAFARNALYIASRPLVERTMDAFSSGAVAVVRSGPFAGLKMLRHSSGTAHVAKILGTYEAQLTPWIERLVANQPSRVVNIGCGDGYYLSGMALRLPGIPCIGFDAQSLCRQEAADTAALNDVSSQVSVKGLADTAALNEVLVDDALLIVDCEGAELDILDPAKSPALLRCDILVELHDYLAPGATAALVARFAATHDIDTVGSLHSPSADLAHLPEIVHLMIVCENRDVSQEWMLLTARPTRAALTQPRSA